MHQRNADWWQVKCGKSTFRDHLPNCFSQIREKHLWACFFYHFIQSFFVLAFQGEYTGLMAFGDVGDITIFGFRSNSPLQL